MKRSFWTVFCALTLLLSSAVPAGAFEIGAEGPVLVSHHEGGHEGGFRRKGRNGPQPEGQPGGRQRVFPDIRGLWRSGQTSPQPRLYADQVFGIDKAGFPVNFNGQTFAAGSDVNTDLKLRMLDLEYQYKFLDLENILAGFSLSAIGQIKYIDGEAKSRAPATATSADFTVRVPIPMVGVGAHIGLLAGLLEARAKVTGVAYSRNYLYEGLADLSSTPFPFLDIHGGYKIIRLKIDHNDKFLDTQFQGPYVGLTVSF